MVPVYRNGELVAYVSKLVTSIGAARKAGGTRAEFTRINGVWAWRVK